MKRKERLCFLVIIMILIGATNKLVAQKNALYPAGEDRKTSPGQTDYYIDPQSGNDKNLGTSRKNSWKTFKRVNHLILAAGDRVIITCPGSFDQSLVIMARGTETSPVKVSFAPGRYDFFPGSSFKTTFHISNTNDVPYGQKAIAIYFSESKYVSLNAYGANVVLRGKMIETCIDHCENISIKGISFDYERPTVSELTVLSVNDRYADLKINHDSRYSIKDSVLTWEGEGWRHAPGWYWQSMDLKTGMLSRIDLSLSNVTFTEQNGGVRARFKQNPGFKTGVVYQSRDVTRDCAGIFMQRSKNISLQGIRIYFMHGMGIVSQFCEDIFMDSIIVKPNENSGRTCSAWADILHFSGCRGKIEIKNSYLSAANDDAINIHGTHLRIVERLNPTQLRVQFMHNQTYGFAAFIPGDSIGFIHAQSLLEQGVNVILKCERVNGKEILLTLHAPIPDEIDLGYVIENISWTPTVWVHHNTITKIPTRGMLVTTRRKVLIEKNVFERTNGSAILVADDAESWFESGLVKDLNIYNNMFIGCGDPVINIHPENREFKGAVHQNISVIGNSFELQGAKAFSAQSSSNLTFSENTIKTETPVAIKDLVVLENCQHIDISNNKN